MLSRTNIKVPSACSGTTSDNICNIPYEFIFSAFNGVISRLPFTHVTLVQLCCSNLPFRTLFYLIFHILVKPVQLLICPPLLSSETGTGLLPAVAMITLINNARLILLILARKRCITYAGLLSSFISFFCVCAYGATVCPSHSGQRR